MKIKLLHDILVDPKHGMTEGRVLDAYQKDSDDGGRGMRCVWVTGDDGTEVKIHGHEYERLPQSPSVPTERAG